LGCALWDGGVVLTRWIYANRDLFRNQTVLELGAGCGLPGIMAAKFAKSVILTEYIEQLVNNIQYNITLNSEDNDDYEDEDDTEGEKVNKDLTKIAKAGFLDWFQIESENDANLTPQIRCATQEYGKKFIEQDWYRCLTCFNNGDSSLGVCTNCANSCHSGHAIQFAEHSRFRCDCDVTFFLFLFLFLELKFNFFLKKKIG